MYLDHLGNPVDVRNFRSGGDIVDLSQLQRSPNYYETGSGTSATRRAKNASEIEAAMRVNLLLLETAFMKDPVAASGVRFYQAGVDASRAVIWSPKRRTQIAIDDVINNSENFNETFYKYVPEHMAVYGRSYIEYLRGDSGRIWDFAVAHPRTMDFIRKDTLYGDGEVVVDNLGRPAGYIQQSVYGEFTQFTRQQMAYQPLFQLHPTEHGIGFIEMMYGDINLKENVEQAATAQAYAAGFPKPISTYGNQTLPPGPDLKNASDKLGRDLANDDKDWASIPYGVELNWFKGEDVGANTIAFLDTVIGHQCTVLGIPKPILMQDPANANKFAMEALLDQMVMMFHAFQRRLQLEERIYDVLKQNNMPHQEVTVTYGPMGIHEIKARSTVFFRAIKSFSDEVKDELLSEVEWRQSLDEVSAVKDWKNTVRRVA